MKTIGITGGSGLVGSHLTNALITKGYHVIIFTRKKDNLLKKINVTFAFWDPKNEKCDTEALKKLDAMVHLSGAGVSEKRWTKERKKEIAESRIIGTHFLIEQLKLHAFNCKSFISASAIGFYGATVKNQKPFIETDSSSTDFLGTICQQWEHEALNASSLMRTVIFRFGIVLAKENGAFPEFYNPLKYGIMPILGSGNQIMSWIHADDLAEMIAYAIQNTKMEGIYNAVSPKPANQKKIIFTIARVMGGIKIPVFAPSFALKILLGEMSIEILKSCNVSARKIKDSGFVFKYPVLEDAIRAILLKY